MLLCDWLVTSLSSERVLAPEKVALTCGFSFEPTTMTLWRAASTRAADWRRSRLLAIASETTVSRLLSLRDFTQSPATSLLPVGFGAELHTGGRGVAFGSA